jgi:hypothetical protein
MQTVANPFVAHAVIDGSGVEESEQTADTQHDDHRTAPREFSIGLGSQFRPLLQNIVAAAESHAQQSRADRSDADRLAHAVIRKECELGSGSA